VKVTCVGINPTSEQKISLTPELLAATGARYSRNNEGLEAILEKIEGMDQDKAVDSIFKMVDYGHRSISDMAPVAMFIDNISLWMALRLWQWCPTAGGQESSTRYVKLKLENIVTPPTATNEFHYAVVQAFSAYNEAYEIWSDVGNRFPQLMGIPDDVTDSKKLDRLIRNFAFDRARYFLPMCCQTNVMLVMPARSWVDLIKMLWSDVSAESVALAEQMTNGLESVTPRLTKHARVDDSYSKGIETEFQSAVQHAKRLSPAHVRMYHPAVPYAMFHTPPHITMDDMIQSLENHDNRYDYFGPAVRRTVVRFGWKALTIAELRDLNRHRTGTKEFTLAPVGSYFADDQVEKVMHLDAEASSKLNAIRHKGENLTILANLTLASGNPSFVYLLPLGAQCAYEHVTTADKFLYQCELRTGLGAHYTYAARMREVLELWHREFPETRTMIRPGMAEPE